LYAGSITPAVLEAAVTPRQCDRLGLTQIDKVEALSAASAFYIDTTAREIREKAVVISNDHRAQLFKWMTNFVEGEEYRYLLQKASREEDIVRSLDKFGVKGLLIGRLGSQLTDILTGKAEALPLNLQSNLLYTLYHEDESQRANHYLAEYIKRFGFQNKRLRILEIGGGTGGATLQMLQASSPNAEPFCSEYMFTDISAGFFEIIRTGTLKD
jgi:hypothetical protein